MSERIKVKRDGPRGWHWIAAAHFDPAKHELVDPPAAPAAAPAAPKAAQAADTPDTKAPAAAKKAAPKAAQE